MKCVKCGRTMVVRTGKNGKFYGCPGYPQCKSTAPYKEVRTPQVRVQREWSNFQLDIFDAVGRSDDNLLVEATAGSGKTSTSVEALNYATRYPKVAFVAFNRSIAQDFKAKVPDGVHASTYHALGLKSIMQARGNEVKVEETKNFKLFTQFTDQMSEAFQSTATDYRSEVLRLVGLAKNVMLDVTGTESFRTLADEYGIDIGDDTESGLVLDLAFKVYKASVDDNYTIDFDDMIHWCATGRVEPLAFDFVVTDECLPYKTPVLLSDGTSMTIGEMVDSRFDGDVLTYNEFTGVQESKKVVGWHKIPNNKKLYEITVGWNKRYGEKNTITCTEDHKILTGYGWTMAEKVVVGDIVQMHTLNLGHVIGIKETTIDDSWVYDITVEDNHNFYANGILVHNCQDMNGARIQMLLRMLRNGGRSMSVGDRKQAIYQWAGASEGAMDIIKRATNSRELPLSITYRCPVSHVKLAQELVPQIQARPNAPEGVIGYLKPWQLTNFLRDGDMVMCRVNAPLVKPAFEMLAQGKKAIIVGRDIGTNLANLIDRVARKSGVTGTNQMLDELTKYVDMQVYRLEKTGKISKAEMLKDQLETVEAIADGCDTVSQVTSKITGIFSDDRDGVRFSSVHRSKGLEANRTFILRPELMPFPKATTDQEVESEMNVKYVSLTRSKSEMHFVA